MPLRHQPPSLFSCALMSICRHFEYICYGVRDRRHMAEILEDDTYLKCTGPFVHCPTRILEGALRTLPEVRSVRHVQTRHLHILLQPQLESLDLTFGTGDVHRAIELLVDRCMRLKRLNISYLRTVEPNLLMGLTPNLTHLTHLNLSHTEANDSVMSAVGQHCPVLRDVNVSFCPISERGLGRLFWDNHQKQSTCPLVTCVNITGCQVSPGAVREALNLRPTLQQVEHENSLLAFDSRYGYSWADEQPYSILSLTATGALVTDVAISSVVAACPSLTSLTLQGCTVSDTTLLLAMQLTELTQLRLTNVSDEALQFSVSVFPVLTVVGARLTSLLLTSFTCADVALLAVACPHLENLALSDIAVFEPVTSSLTSASESGRAFEHLQALEVWTHPTNTTLSSPVLLRLLRHCRGLRNLLVSGAQSLTDGLLMELWLTTNPMEELSRLTLDSCPNVSAETLAFLLQQHNRLSMLRVWNCFGVNKANEKDICEVIKQGNMDLYFEWFAWEG